MVPVAGGDVRRPGGVAGRAGPAASPDWTAVEGEALGYYQALLRFDTSATERAEAEYLKRVLDEHGIPARILATDPERPNVVARLKGNGRKRPLLLIGHLDTVPVDASKWKFPPFSATRDGGFVYGRGAIDDKDNLAAALMAMLLLKRQNVALDRDVILLAESGEESAQQLGLGFMVDQHYPEIDAEFCIAEGGDTIRERGDVRYAAVQVTEKVVRGVELTARGISGHGSVPLTTNPIAHLGSAVGKFAAWQPEVRIDETTGPYFSDSPRWRHPRKRGITATCSLPTQRWRVPRPTGSSQTNRATRRWRAPRCPPRSSTAAIAPT